MSLHIKSACSLWASPGPFLFSVGSLGPLPNAAATLCPSVPFLNSQSSYLEIWFPSDPSHSTLGLSETLFILSTFLLTTTEEALGNLLTEGNKNNSLIGKSQKFQNVTGSWLGSLVCNFYPLSKTIPGKPGVFSSFIPEAKFPSHSPL